MSSTLLRGTGVALVTPFKHDNSIDFQALKKLVEFVTKRGADFLVALGTTAETPTLSKAEQQAVIDVVVEQNAGKLPIVVGIGSNNTQHVIDVMHQSNLKGVDAILNVTPYYNKPTQKGLYEHFKAVAAKSPLPIVLYNVPGRTGVNLTAETTLKLAEEEKNIIAIKEASGNINQISYILRSRPKGFAVLSGDDNLTLPELAIGIDGVISVAANAFPADFCKMVKLGLEGNFTEATKLHLKMVEAIDYLFVEGNPAGVKAALAAQQLIENHLRLPLVPASAPVYDFFTQYLSR